jgi:hypothetical protein
VPALAARHGGLDRADDKHHRERQRAGGDREHLRAVRARIHREPGSGQRRQVGQTGVQRGRGGHRDRRAEDGERAGLDGGRRRELAAADAQRGQQAGLLGPHAGGEPAGERERGSGQDGAERGDGEHHGHRDLLLVLGVPHGRRQPGVDALDLHPVAEHAGQPAVGTGQGASDLRQLVPGGAGQVGAGGDLQPAHHGAAREQVAEVDQERPVGGCRLGALVGGEAELVPGAGQRVTLPAGARQRAGYADDLDAERRGRVEGPFRAEADAVAGAEPERPRGRFEDDGLRRRPPVGRGPRPPPGGQRGAVRQTVHPGQVRLRGHPVRLGRRRQRPQHGRRAGVGSRGERRERRGEQVPRVGGDGRRAGPGDRDRVGGGLDVVGGGAGHGDLQLPVRGAGDQQGAGAEQRGADRHEHQQGGQQRPLRAGPPGEDFQHGSAGGSTCPSCIRMTRSASAIITGSWVETSTVTPSDSTTPRSSAITAKPVSASS